MPGRQLPPCAFVSFVVKTDVANLIERSNTLAKISPVPLCGQALLCGYALLIATSFSTSAE
jgi:hypothetical protein